MCEESTHCLEIGEKEGGGGEYSQHRCERMKVRTDILHVLEGRWSVLPKMGCEYVDVDEDRWKHAQTGNKERKEGGCEYSRHK
jgi:hypothetical protein